MKEVIELLELHLSDEVEPQIAFDKDMVESGDAIKWRQDRLSEFRQFAIDLKQAIKILNAAQSEALSVGNNEQAKEDFEESFVDYMERTYDWDEDGDTPRQMFNSFLKSLTNKSD
ncbi:hypothetical protein AWW68_19550 [Roseivirga spongicola]|uniref:Uncharacterized protein n=1 Tax=Roseivirga spongicola TaxID=333140 RepID=A0A150XCM1_9BACT|nr:hypothetical protein [Roseivirga spongicola]KYG76442.1 hypothetical protein AWW68_19550 [Roseivirga spongicola]